MVNEWLALIKSAKKTGIIQDGKKKVHFLLHDGRELVEEYNLDTSIVVRRAWKEKGKLNQDAGWTVEIGDPEPRKDNNEIFMIKESSNAPFVTRRITKTSLEWRIRNLPYPKDVFDVKVDDDGHSIVVKTTNKKYYKKLTVPDLERVGLKPVKENLSFTHQFNTLIITYKKPPSLIQLEKEVLKEVENVKVLKDNNPQCPTS
ncbi:protein DPCD [Chelonus insularis]|uniref:protein DPCD n=1 Tax=Chelonus insularis TaxID=460826 RepID=UPI00158D21D4|nr:protein DPCD [Chelonus insularis]